MSLLTFFISNEWALGKQLNSCVCIVRDSTPSQRICSGMLSQFCREANGESFLMGHFHAKLLSTAFKYIKAGQLLKVVFFFLSLKVCVSISLKLIWSVISYTCLWHSCHSKLEEKRRQGKEGIRLLLAITGSRFYLAVPFLTRSSCKERITCDLHSIS